jgi:hypothetical protein
MAWVGCKAWRVDILHRVLVALLALGLAACKAPGSRRFAVTVQDSIEAECVGVSDDYEIAQETIEGLAQDVERVWEATQLANPPLPEGRLLRVNEVENRMRAWFDPYLSANDFIIPHRYADPRTVYQGEVQDEYVEGIYEERFNTDIEDEQRGRPPCGDRLRVHGIMTLTEAEGVRGRIRWTEVQWVDTSTSSCGGYVSCARDIQLEGLEE